MSNTYILVPWPESQNYMDEPWFNDEAILANEEDLGPSAYMIPQERILVDQEGIIEAVEALAKIYPSTEEDERIIEEEWGQGVPFEGGMSTSEHIIDIKRLL